MRPLPGPAPNNSSEKRKLQTHFIFFVLATFHRQSLSDVLLPNAAAADRASGIKAKCQISIQFIVSFQCLDTNKNV